MTDPRFPIGKFQFPETVTPEHREQWLREIAELPLQMRQAVEGMDEKQLDTPYRPGGWTARQVVHHVADSHINSYVRFRLALTEDTPPVKGYAEDRWAELVDAKTAPVGYSLSLLDALHARWILLLRELQTEHLARRFQHSELGPVTLERNVALYAWHGKHHTAHVQMARDNAQSGAVSS